MKSKINSNVHIGFFKRVINSFKNRKSEKLKINEKFFKDWDKIKWKVRFTKFFIASFFYVFGKLIFYDSVLNINKIKFENDIINAEFTNYLDNNWGKETNSNFIKEFEQQMDSIKTLLVAKFEKYDEIQNNQIERKSKFLINFFKNILVNLKQLKTNNQNNSYFENINTIEFEKLKSCLYFVNLKRKYNLKEAMIEIKPMILNTEYLDLL
jgi:hypothetical protein